MKKVRFLTAAVLLATSTPAFGQVTVGHVDSFLTTTEGWQEGGPSPNPPTWVDGVGAGSEAGGFMQNISSGSGAAGSRFAMWNQSSNWTGDYTTAGVTGISMWVDSVGSSLLPLRLAFNGPGGWVITPFQTVSSNAVAGDWTQFTFDVTVGGLTHVSGGTGDVAATMASVSRFEILLATGTPSAGGGLLRGDRVAADLRFDDIAAIPEPGTWALLAGGVLAIGLIYRRRR